MTIGSTIWFALDTPVVNRKVISDKELLLEQSRLVPNSRSLLEDGWYSLNAKGFDNVFWTYDFIGHKLRPSYQNLPKLICNGINITDNLSLDDFKISPDFNFICAKTPSLIVFDQDGKLPINLERNSLVEGSLPFMGILTTDISIYIANEIKSYCQKLDFMISESTIKSLHIMPIKGLISKATLSGMGSFIINRNSILPMDFDLLCHEKPSALYVDARRGYKSGAFNSDLFKDVCSYYVISNQISETKQKRTQWIRNFFQIEDARKKHGFFDNPKGILLLPIYNRRILIKKLEIPEIVGSGYVPTTYWGLLRKEWGNDKWAMLTLGHAPDFEGDIEQLCKELDDTHSYGFYVYYLDWTKTTIKDKSEMSPFAKAWLDINDGQAVLTQQMAKPEK